MAEKTDQEIIEELGLEQNDSQNTEKETFESQENGEDISESNNLEENSNELYEDDTIENEDLDEKPIQKKKPKLLKVLMSIIAILSIVLTLGTILYLAGFFDDEQKKEPQIKAQAVETKQNSEVDIKDIDKNKLNNKLKRLTKTEILDKEELEAEERRLEEEARKKEEARIKAIEEARKKEEERLAKEKEALEKEKQLLEERQKAIKKEQEEFLKLQEQIKKEFEEQKAQIFNELEKQKNTISKDVAEEDSKTNVETIIEKTINNQTATQVTQKPIEEEIVNTQVTQEDSNNDMGGNLFLQFINVAIIKGDLHKSYLDKVESIDKKISLCRDTKNRIEIYFGPYESTTERNKIFNTLIDNGFKDAFLVDFTKEEYQKRCNY